jgi:hypothetical protein
LCRRFVTRHSLIHTRRELLALASIPLAATFMARGVGGYVAWLPWYVGAAPAVLAVGGLGYKYVKEALDWPGEEW